MRGIQVIPLVLFFTLNVEGCAAQVSSEHGLHQSKQKGSNVLSLGNVIDSLAANDATATSVAASVGTLGEREASEYRIIPANRDMGEVRLGTRMHDELHKTPLYLQFYLPATAHYRLHELEPTCSNWKKVPGNPGASPFRFGCRLPVSKGVPVNLLAVLSGPIESDTSRVQELLLQRTD